MLAILLALGGPVPCEAQLYWKSVDRNLPIVQPSAALAGVAGTEAVFAANPSCEAADVFAGPPAPKEKVIVGLLKDIEEINPASMFRPLPVAGPLTTPGIRVTLEGGERYEMRTGETTLLLENAAGAGEKATRDRVFDWFVHLKDPAVVVLKFGPAGRVVVAGFSSEPAEAQPISAGPPRPCECRGHSNPKAACGCGPKCDCKYDPYGYGDDYAAFREYMTHPNSWGALYVGVPDKSVGTYEPHCRVPSGFKGLADGVYDCRYDPATKRPVMERRPDPKPAPPMIPTRNAGPDHVQAPPPYFPLRLSGSS